MKREIKFRGWRRKYQCWEYGYLIECAAPELNEIVEVIKHGGRIIAAVERDSIGQYTGLHDKNGREIYEGDIVSFGSVWNNGANEDIDEEFHIGVVEYDPHDAVYNVNCEESGEHRFLFMEVVNYDGFGVIGNIFENPELLEAKQ